MFESALVRGEHVTVLGPKPDDWTGLGQTYDDALLVSYPDGEVGAVPKEQVQSLTKEG